MFLNTMKPVFFIFGFVITIILDNYIDLRIEYINFLISHKNKNVRDEATTPYAAGSNALKKRFD